MSVSIRNLLVKRFSELKEELTKLDIDTTLIPMDVTPESNFQELLESVEMVFPNGCDIDLSLRTMCFMRGVRLTDEQFAALGPLVNRYLSFLGKVRSYL